MCREVGIRINTIRPDAKCSLTRKPNQSTKKKLRVRMIAISVSDSLVEVFYNVCFLSIVEPTSWIQITPRFTF